MTVLVTAFEPFGGSEENASLAALSLLPERTDGLLLEKRVLPTAFGESWETLSRAAEEVRPDAVLCLGEAGGRREVTVERVAVNLMDARIPDNAGARPRDKSIDPYGPAAYFSTMPTREMAEAADAALSYTAGTFVCNCIFYLSLRRFDVPCGFIHVPTLETMSVQTAAGKIRAALGALGKYMSEKPKGDAGNE